MCVKLFIVQLFTSYLGDKMSASVIVSDRYAIEEETLLQIPMVQSISVNMAIDIREGKVSLDILDTWEGMRAIGREFQRLNISYETIGGPARAVKKATQGFLDFMAEADKA